MMSLSCHFRHVKPCYIDIVRKITRNTNSATVILAKEKELGSS